MENNVTKKVEFKDLAELKAKVSELGKAVEAPLNEYKSLVLSAFGRFPKTEMELVEFIERVVGMKND